MLPRLLSCLGLLLLPSCALFDPTHSAAGSVALEPNARRTLHVSADNASRLRLELWNRGPGRVTFDTRTPTISGRGEITSGRVELEWQTTAGEIAIDLATDAAGATIHYIVHASRPPVVRVAGGG